jgi:pimeloyl-ACP methyl ester carboxylesterase
VGTLEREIRIGVTDALGQPGSIVGDLYVPRCSRGLVTFAHGSGSSRRSPRNRIVADALHASGFGSLLFDLLTLDEERVDVRTREFRFDIRLLADRLLGAMDELERQPGTTALPLGLFGASTGAAAALIAAADRTDVVRAVVSRGGRPDLAGDALATVESPTLLLVGGWDDVVIGLNREAAARMRCEREVSIVPGATHLFEEPGTLEEVARRSTGWFERHLTSASS